MGSYQKNIPSATHIPGCNNFDADYCSRIFNENIEWKLHTDIFCRVTDIDLFASRLNKQLEKYVSWNPEPDAYASDAFSILWTNFNPYIFCPFSLISQTLNKIKDEKVKKLS